MQKVIIHHHFFLERAQTIGQTHLYKIFKNPFFSDSKSTGSQSVVHNTPPGGQQSSLLWSWCFSCEYVVSLFLAAINNVLISRNLYQLLFYWHPIQNLIIPLLNSRKGFWAVHTEWPGTHRSKVFCVLLF